MGKWVNQKKEEVDDHDDHDALNMMRINEKGSTCIKFKKENTIVDNSTYS